MFFAHGNPRKNWKRIGMLLGFGVASGLFFKDAFVVGRKNLDESRKEVIEVFENVCRMRRAGVVLMILDETSNGGDFGRILQGGKFNHLHVDLWREVLVNIEYICNSTRHASCKITSRRTQNDNTTTGHVFATMIAHTFNN